MDPLWLLLIGILIVIVSILTLRLHPFLALVIAGLAVGTLTPPEAVKQFGIDQKMPEEKAEALSQKSAAKRLTENFGITCGKVGILIAMASVVGACLLESGAADRIVRTGLKIVGESKAPASMMGSSFVLGIPVFFDTVFYLMMPVGKTLAYKSGRNYGLYVMCIIAGGTMAHSLVPPTPGPLFVASELNIDIGAMMLAGLLLGCITLAIGYAYAIWSNKKWPLPLRESTDISFSDLEAFSKKKEEALPPFWLSVLPILIPVILIAGKTILPQLNVTSGPIINFFNFFGDKNIAMCIAAAIGILMLYNSKAQSQDQIKEYIQNALLSAGLIILITSAGGAFGGILRQTGIGSRIEELSSAFNVGVIPLAFFVTVLIRCAQGSATVAMITSVGMFSGMASPEQLGFSPIYLALAIGCGSKPFPWMNDSGFWVISKLSGMTEAETLRNFSTMISLMGLGGLITVMIAARLFPLA